MRTAAALWWLAAAAAAAAAVLVAGAPLKIRVGVFDFVTYPDDPGYLYDALQTQAISVNFLIAAKHFNARSSVIPILQTPALQSCPTQIDIPIWCDTGGSSRQAIIDVWELRGAFDALAGFASSTELQTTSQMAEIVEDLVIASHWTSSPLLDDRTMYPLVVRTGQDDGVIAKPLIHLLVTFGYTRAALLFLTDDSGPAFRDSMAAECVAHGIDLLSLAYIQGDADSIEAAFKQLAASSLSVVYVYGYATDYILGVMPPLAAKYNLTGNYLWIVTNFDRFPSSEELRVPVIRDFYRGSLGVLTRIPAQYEPRFDSYVAAWETNAQYIPYMNSIFPPHGKVFNSCLHSALDYQVPDNLFNLTQSYAFPVWAWAYDAVMALGVAACGLKTSSNFTGTDLYNALLKVDFEGMSGRVRFDPATGSRYVDALIPDLVNWITDSTTGFVVADNNAATYVATTAAWDDGVWQFASEDTLEFRTGIGIDHLPPDVVEPREDYNYLSDDLVNLAYALVAIILFCCACLMAWLAATHKSRAVKQSQPRFMAAIIFGVAVSSVSILGLTVDDNPERAQLMTPDQGCNFFFCVYFAGFAFALSMLLAKSFRVWTVFSMHTLKIGIPVHVILLCVLVSMGVEFMFIGLLLGIAPLAWTRNTLSVDAFQSPLASFGSCAAPSSNSTGLLSALIIWQVVLLLACLYLGEALKKLPQEFHEAVYITLAVATILQLLLIAVPVVIALYDSVSGHFVVLCLVVLFSDLVLLGFMFGPKVHPRTMSHGSENSTDQMDGVPELTVEDGLRIARIKDRFVKYAEKRMVIENVHFVCDVMAWRDEYDAQTKQWRQRTSRALLGMFITEGAMLQVNISGTLREMTEHAVLDVDEPAPDCFDDACADICALLNANVWGGFVAQGGLFGFDHNYARASKPAAAAAPAAAPAAAAAAPAASGKDSPAPLARKSKAASSLSDFAVSRRTSDMSSVSEAKPWGGRPSDLKTINDDVANV